MPLSMLSYFLLHLDRAVMRGGCLGYSACFIFCFPFSWEGAYSSSCFLRPKRDTPARPVPDRAARASHRAEMSPVLGISDRGTSSSGMSVEGISVRGSSSSGMSVVGMSVVGMSVVGISVRGASPSGMSMVGVSSSGSVPGSGDRDSFFATVPENRTDRSYSHTGSFPAN